MVGEKMTQKERYHLYKDKGICVSCYKEKATQGGVFCDKCREKRNKAHKDDYEWRKEKGICVNCGKEYACYGLLLCHDCWEKSYVRNKQYYENNREVHKAKMKENAKKRYAELKEKGLCVKCGKYKAVQGMTLCLSCRVKKNMTKDKRWNNDIPRNERNSYGLCYVCATPLNKHEKLCDTCYERVKQSMNRINENPNAAMKKNRQRWEGEFSLIFKK